VVSYHIVKAGHVELVHSIMLLFFHYTHLFFELLVYFKDCL
jgi:hypothetical protein